MANIIERPDGIRIATCFISLIIFTSLISRIWRSTELRSGAVEFDKAAQQFVKEAMASTEAHTLEIIAHRKIKETGRSISLRLGEVCEDNHLPYNTAILFLEIEVADASVFSNRLRVRGVQVGTHRVLRARSAAVPNAIAAILLSASRRYSQGFPMFTLAGWKATR